MKSLVSAFLLLATIVTFSEGNPYTYDENKFVEIKHCVSHYDCPSGSCCMLTPNRFAHPHCVERPKSGHTCRPKPMKESNRVLDYMNGGKVFLKEAYMNVCPCVRGLVCDAVNHVCRNPHDYYNDDIEQ